MDTVAGRKVLITGAAMGMGKIYARLAVAEGAAAVVLWDVNQPALDAAAAELKAKGGKVHPYLVDVSTPDAIRNAAERVKREVGDIELLFNNAGIVVGAWFWDHDWSQIGKTMAINALAPMYVANAFLPGMIRAQGECRIVNVASAAGLVSNPRMSVYCSSKWAVVGWSDSLRLELEQAGHRHVKVTTVCPSYISTGMFEGVKAPLLTPILKPETVVATVWRRMKAGAPFVKLPWTVKIVGIMKGLLPVAWFDFIAGRVFGVYKTMEEFKGRSPE